MATTQRKIKLIVGIIVIAVALTLVLMNLQDVTVKVLFIDITMPLVVYSLVLLGLGFIAGALVGLTVGGKRGKT